MKSFLKWVVFPIGCCCILITMLFLILEEKDSAIKNGPLGNKRYPDTLKQAEAAATTYFKEKHNLAIVITNVATTADSIVPRIFLEGHAKEDEELKFSATINIDEKYRVEDDRLQRKKR